MSEILTPEQMDDLSEGAAYEPLVWEPHEALRAKLTEVERERDALQGDLANRINGQRDEIEADRDRLAAEVGRLREAMKRAKTFIEYARYELQPVLMPGAQFPSQACADKELAAINAALSPEGKE